MVVFRSKCILKVSSICTNDLLLLSLLKCTGFPIKDWIQRDINFSKYYEFYLWVPVAFPHPPPHSTELSYGDMSIFPKGETHEISGITLFCIINCQQYFYNMPRSPGYFFFHSVNKYVSRIYYLLMNKNTEISKTEWCPHWWHLKSTHTLHSQSYKFTSSYPWLTP